MPKKYVDSSTVNVPDIGVPKKTPTIEEQMDSFHRRYVDLETANKVWDELEAWAPSKIQHQYGDEHYRYYRFMRGWREHNITATVTITYDIFQKIEVAGKEATVYKPRATVDWSITKRTVDSAVACLALYRDVIEFAALLQTELPEVGKISE